MTAVLPLIRRLFVVFRQSCLGRFATFDIEDMLAFSPRHPMSDTETSIHLPVADFVGNSILVYVSHDIRDSFPRTTCVNAEVVDQMEG